MLSQLKTYLAFKTGALNVNVTQHNIEMKKTIFKFVQFQRWDLILSSAFLMEIKSHQVHMCANALNYFKLYISKDKLLT